MANCITCKRDVGCSCNLTDGKCLFCLSKTASFSASAVNGTSDGTSGTVTIDGPNFVSIVSNPYLTQEEKVRRINEIIDKTKV